MAYLNSNTYISTPQSPMQWNDKISASPTYGNKKKTLEGTPPASTT